MKTSQRNSNIEFLRILLMIGVIILHINNPSIGGAMLYVAGYKKWLIYFFESIFVCSVDLFIMISGYYLINIDTRNVWKPVELIFQVILVKVVLYFLRTVLGNTDLSIGGIIGSFIPSNYFAVLYAVVYLLSPMVNRSLKNMDAGILGKALNASVVLLSILPTLVDLFSEVTSKEWLGLSPVGMYGSQWGYSLVNFILMYIIGAYLRIIEENRGKQKETDKKKKSQTFGWLVCLFACGIVLTVWACVNDYTGYNTERSAWEYCNPIVVYEAILILKIFKSFEIKSKVINRLAGACFITFLIQNTIIQKLPVEQVAKENVIIMILLFVLFAVGIYLLCWLVYEVYIRIFGKLFKKIAPKDILM